MATVLSYLVSFFSLSSLRYLLSFNKSNNESSPPSDPQEQSGPPQEMRRPVMPYYPSQLESGSSPTHAANTPLEERLSASIGVLGVNVVLFVNAPKVDNQMLDGVHHAAILLALVTSTGCVALYLLRSDSTLVLPPQKRLIRMTVGFTALLVVLHFFFDLSASSFLFFIVFFSLGAGFALGYLCIPWNEENYNQTAPLPEDNEQVNASPV